MGIHEREYYRDDSINLQPDWNGRSAVSLLIIANVAIFVANILFSDIRTRGDIGVLNRWLQLSPEHAQNPLQWFRCLSYAFAHAGAFHILFNMLGLYFLGRSVELRYGKKEFLRIYLLCATTCGVLWLLKYVLLGTAPDKVGLVGASGAVICIEMLFVFNFPTATVTFFIFPMPAWVLGILIVLMNFLNQPGNVAVDVHLIGILFAAGYFFLGVNFGAFGDFGGTIKRTKRKWFGPKLRVHSESGREQDDSLEADRILAKIHEQGKDSLTNKERKFLERYSRAVRDKKSN
jgi:membrane associated rhomboid family serine protease